MSYDGEARYKIICDSKCVAMIKPPYEVGIRDIEIDDTTISEIIRILNDYQVSSWDGFHKSAKNILDGSSFSFTLKTSDEKEIYSKNRNNIFLFRTAVFDGFDINQVTQIDILSSEDDKHITDSSQILKIYEEWKDVIVEDRVDDTCDSDTTIYRFIMDNQEEYEFRQECDYLVLHSSRYSYHK